jgi:hypothetical protein
MPSRHTRIEPPLDLPPAQPTRTVGIQQVDQRRDMSIWVFPPQLRQALL